MFGFTTNLVTKQNKQLSQYGMDRSFSFISKDFKDNHQSTFGTVSTKPADNFS